MTFFADLSDKFWSKDVWLPPNITWDDLKPNDRIKYADHRDLLYPLPMAVGLLLLRFVLERYWYAPFGLYLGIKPPSTRKVAKCERLENVYKSKVRPSHKELETLAVEVAMSERQIERWLRTRRQADKPSTLKKFCENSFRCTYYIYSFIYGLLILWDEPWLWEINHCWYSYPHQSVTRGVWWYYMVSMAFYWSLMVSQFFDVKHKDFWQMCIHHVATIVLMDFSWVCNMTRVGSLVLVIHDCADIFLEGAKMAKYANYQKVCDALFGVFTLTWIATRLGLFPFWIIWNTAIDAPEIVDMFPAYYIFNGLLCLLLVLHIFWTYLILKIAYNSVLVGKMEGDIRSSSDEDVEDSPTPVVAQNGVKKEQ